MQGELLGEISFAKFMDGYGGATDYSLSPDKTKIAFQAGEDLKLLDTSTNQEETIINDIFRKYSSALIQWRSDDKILFISELPDSYGYESRLYRISEVDLVSGKIQDLHKFSYLDKSWKSDLSPDKTHLAIKDAGKHNGFYTKLSILNLSSGKLTNIAGQWMESHFGSISWRPDGKALAFVENGTTLKIWSEEDPRPKEILTAPKDHLLYSVIWTNNSIGYYSGDSRGQSNRKADLIFVDPITGERKGSANIYVNGHLFYAPKSNRVIAEVN